MNKQEVIQNTTDFFKKVGMSEEDVLIQIRDQKERSRDFVRTMRQQFYRDQQLMDNRKDKEDMIGDTTIFNIHTALVARSFTDKLNVTFKGGIGEDQKVETLQKMLNEDFDTPKFKEIKRQVISDKFFYGVGIIARTGWDGIRKENVFESVDPNTWYPDINGDYVCGNYSYSGFEQLRYKQELKGYMNVDKLENLSSVDGVKQQKEDYQIADELAPLEQDDIYNPQFEIYTHYAIFEGKWGYVTTGNNETVVLSAGLVKPGCKDEEEDESLIKPPFVFYYWKPKRYNPFGFRVIDYIRDVQLNKSKIANLRLDKMKAELYPMYLFNSDYVKGTDLGFGFNKFIPYKSGIDGPINPQNVLSPIVPNTKIDTSMAIDQSLDRQVEKSTSIGEVAQGTTPESRETATTNSLVQSNTDINLSLNTKIDNMAEESLVIEWMKGYYQNFTSGDKKIVYASEDYMQNSLVIKKKDFYIEGNLKIDIESNTETEQKKQKQRLMYNQVAPIILQDPSTSAVSKKAIMRNMLDLAGVSKQDIDLQVGRLVDEVQQAEENQLLAENIYVDISPDDDDLAHLELVESVAQTDAGAAHKIAHIQQYIAKGKPQGIQQGGMLNQLAAQSMGQASSESSQMNAQAQPQTAY